MFKKHPLKKQLQTFQQVVRQDRSNPKTCHFMLLNKGMLYEALPKLLCCMQGSSIEDAIASAGGVPEALVKAFSLLLQNQTLDPALIAAAISPPAASELIDAIPEADPVTLHQVR